jgi:transcriptional regulator with XRE-family HTH domain
MTVQARRRGQLLRDLRNNRGMSQERLALEAGLSTMGVYQLEKGQHEGRPATWIALAAALDVHPLHLLALPMTASDPKEVAEQSTGP